MPITWTRQLRASLASVLHFVKNRGSGSYVMSLSQDSASDSTVVFFRFYSLFNTVRYWMIHCYSLLRRGSRVLEVERINKIYSALCFCNWLSVTVSQTDRQVNFLEFENLVNGRHFNPSAHGGFLYRALSGLGLQDWKLCYFSVNGLFEINNENSIFKDELEKLSRRFPLSRSPTWIDQKGFLCFWTSITVIFNFER